MMEKQFSKKSVPKRYIENWILRDNEVIIIDPSKARPIWLNYQAALIWNSCDGKHTVDEILEILSKQFSGEKKVIMEDLMIFLERLEKMKLIEMMEE